MGARVFGALAVYTFWGLPDVCQGWRIWLSIVSFYTLSYLFVGGVRDFEILASVFAADT